MSTHKKRPRKLARIPRARNAHSRQRQRLIEACISALHIYGPSRTTVEKVVGIAKMSPGIVRFYFASKAAMLVASLQYLAAEFEEQLLVPVSRLKSTPVPALELMVDLYLDPEIASPRKVSVWYAFWGEASSRQEYYDICGQKDESFAALVRELIERLIIETSQPQLDPDGIALGLIGVLEMLWQDFAFRTEAEIDRAGAKRRAIAYLRSIFPGQFVGSQSEAGGTANGRRLPGWVYANARLFAAEREVLFLDSWQLAAPQAGIPRAGDFLAVDLGIERVLIVRGAAGEVHAFRNSCSEAPHILSTARGGNVSFIQCTLHGLEFELDGRRRGARGTADLTALELRVTEGLILVRTAERRHGPTGDDPWSSFTLPPGSRSLGPPAQTAVAADWKLVVEQGLESQMMDRTHARSIGWSARSYRQLAGPAADLDRPRRLFAPNHLVEQRSDGYTILQVLPSGPGQSILRSHEFTVCEQDRLARAIRYLASRLKPSTRPSDIAVTESIQKGIVAFGHEAAESSRAAAETVAFRRRLVTLMPVMASIRPPTDFQ
jgi:TetR/AcrR family transcriptional repressor of bet genes